MMYSANCAGVNFKPELRTISMASRTAGESDGAGPVGGVAGWGWARGGKAGGGAAGVGAAEGSKPGCGKGTSPSFVSRARR